MLVLHLMKIDMYFCSALILTALSCSIACPATRHCLLLHFPLTFGPDKPGVIRLYLSLGLHSFHLQWIRPCQTGSLQWEFGCHCYETHLDCVMLCALHYKDSVPMAQSQKWCLACQEEKLFPLAEVPCWTSPGLSAGQSCRTVRSIALKLLRWHDLNFEETD